jgi:hypothetical protein
VELFINRAWTERYGKVYMAEAIAYSESGNHATIYATGITADEADAKLIGALRELKLIPEVFSTKGERRSDGSL